jgi:hypothetical protein
MGCPYADMHQYVEQIEWSIKSYVLDLLKESYSAGARTSYYFECVA